MLDTKRREFLGVLAGTVASLGIAGTAGAETEPHAPIGDAPGLEAWLSRIKGKHRQLFDAPNIHDGMPLAWTRVFLMTNKSVGAAEDDVTAVLVLRHDAIAFAFDHHLWPKYKLGEVFKVTDGATSAPALRNPFYQPKSGELMLPDMAVEALITSGVLVGVCDMALTVYSGKIAKAMNMDAADIKKEWVAGIIPGIQIVPSGVMAVNRVQEHKCTYCYAG